MTTPLLSLLALACTQDTPQAQTRLDALSTGAPVRVEIAGAGGVDVVELPVRLVDAYGAAVPGTTVQVSLSGGAGFRLESETLQLDTDGHAFVRVQADEPGSFTVQITGSGDGAETGAVAQGVALGAPTPTFALDEVLPPPSGSDGIFAVARGSGGLALASTSTIWWMPTKQGGVPWTVLTPPFAIDGIRSAEVDQDGVRDLVVWGEDQVVLLRGRPGGGWSWGAGWQSQDMSVVGAVVVDGDGDHDGDLVIGLSGEDSSRVELLRGNGVWGFTASTPLEHDSPIVDVMAADEDYDGRIDVTVLESTTGWLQRFTLSDNGWVGGSPSVLDRHVFPEDSELLPSADLDADGLLDVIALAGPGTGAQSVVFYDLGDDKKYEQAYPRMWAAVDDVDDDGAADLLLVEDGLLHRIRYDFTAQGYIVSTYGGLADAGPTAAGDVDGDGVSDLAMLDASVVLHKGELDDAGAWSVGERTVLDLMNGLYGPYDLYDVDSDGDLDIVGFVSVGHGVAGFTWWEAAWDDESGVSYTAHPQAVLNATGPALDLAHCAPDWYVLADNQDGGYDEPYKLFRMRIEASEGYVPSLEHGNRVTGSMLACGYPQPEEPTLRRITAASPDGAWTMYAYNIVEVEQGTTDPVQDIAYADTDGDGIDELKGCGSEDCRVIGVDMDGDGVDEVLRDEGVISVEGWGQVLTLDAQGEASVDDVDGDGVLDVIVSDPDAGRIVAVPTLTGTLGPALGWYSTEAIPGAVRTTDYDGDGAMELLWKQDEGLVGTQRSPGGAGR